MQLANVTDTDNSIWERYGVVYQPAFAFINDDGTTEVARLPTGQLAERIEHLLAT